MTDKECFLIKEWTVARDGVSVLGPLNLRARRGKITTLMGPSGSGKTSLLLTLLGYNQEGLHSNGIRIYAGRLLSDGEIPDNSLFIPQTSPFNPNWEVQAFLTRLLWKTPGRSNRNRRVMRVLSRLGINHRARAVVAELSGGEAQRAALAQMFLLEPRLMVCDEFVSALDPAIAVDILHLFRNKITTDGSSAILALHDIQTALRFSDEIAILWPRPIKSDPWVLQVDTLQWRSDIVFTLMCLSHWLQPVGPHSVYSTLIKILASAIYHGLNDIELPSKDSQSTAFSIENDGELTPLPAPIVRDEHTEQSALMEPYRGVVNGRTVIGFTTKDHRREAASTFVTELRMETES